MKGEILLSEGGSPRKVFVCIFGIDRFIAAEEDGRFKFENLAEGNYDVTIIPTLDNYNVFDTANIIVESADTQKPTYEYCIGALISGIREGVRSPGDIANGKYFLTFNIGEHQIMETIVFMN
jgi:hypothetical protein